MLPKARGRSPGTTPRSGSTGGCAPEEVILSPKDSRHPTLAECKELFDYNTDYYA